MKNLKYLFLVLLMSCSTSKVITDYDDKADFSSFKTYAFYEDVGKGLNELDVRRVTSIMNTELNKLGIQESENPDFFINIISNTTEATNNNTIGIGGIPIGGKKLNEEFIVEFVAATNNTLFWEAILNSKINENRKPEEKELHFQEIIKIILEKYPPKQK